MTSSWRIGSSLQLLLLYYCSSPFMTVVPFVFLASLLSVFIIDVAAVGQDLPLYSPNEINVSYNTKDNYCWLLAHSSSTIEDEGRIIIDGGMAKYLVKVNGTDAAVVDLNGYTMSIDLGADFGIEEVPLREWKKNVTTDAPVVNRGGMWENGTHALIQGGHFYSADRYNESVYHVNKTDIPEYEIWAFALDSHTWSRVTYRKDPADAQVHRAVSGAAACALGEDLCYYFGGYYSTYTSPDTPDNFSVAQRGLLQYRPSAQIIRNNSLDGYGAADEGFEYGTLQHLPLGCQRGLLLSIMSEKANINQPNMTNDDLRGTAVDIASSVMLYDIDNDNWHRQVTIHHADQVPVPRIRFCAALVQDEETKSWDLWVYGGQSQTDPSKGVEGAYVLTMPAFVWVRITIPNDNVLLRSHSCHAIGSQLLVIGGAVPAVEVDQGSACTGNPNLVQVLDMNEGGWKNHYSANSPKYRQPPQVRRYAANATAPLAAEGWSSDRVREMFERGRRTDCNKSSKSKNSGGGGGWSPGGIAGVAVGCVAGAGLLVAIGYLIYRSVSTKPHGAVVREADKPLELSTVSPISAETSRAAEPDGMSIIGAGDRIPEQHKRASVGV